RIGPRSCAPLRMQPDALSTVEAPARGPVHLDVAMIARPTLSPVLTIRGPRDPVRSDACYDRPDGSGSAKRPDAIGLHFCATPHPGPPPQGGREDRVPSPLAGEG